MKFKPVLITLLVGSLALFACGTPAATGNPPTIKYGNEASATAAPLVAPPTAAPTAVAPTAIPATDVPTSAPAGTEVKVQIADFAFNPSTLEIKVGTTVTWTNEDSATHTVTADDGSFTSGSLKQGQSFSFTFTQAGTYAYHCGVHASMKATITVTP
jgi:plastocyanin